MINLLLDTPLFAFQWDRLAKPGVIAGIIIMVLGMILLVSSTKLNAWALQIFQKQGKTIKDKTLLFKLTSFALVITGALMAIFMIK